MATRAGCAPGANEPGRQVNDACAFWSSAVTATSAGRPHSISPQCGHEVAVADNFVRRQYDLELGVDSLVPIESLQTRVAGLARAHRQVDRRLRRRPDRRRVHLRDDPRVPPRHGRALRRAARRAVLDDRPQACRLHPDQQRRRQRSTCCTPSPRSTRTSTWSSSAPWASTARRTSTSKRAGWSSPTTAAPTGCSIPKRPGSFYHLSKVHDSHNIEFACRIWGLRATDLNQGVVYGQQTRETALDAGSRPASTTTPSSARCSTASSSRRCSATRSRSTASGGQTRGMIDIRDTVECIRLACENPAERGRVPRLQPVDRVAVGARDRRDRAALLPGRCRDRAPRQPRVEPE